MPTPTPEQPNVHLTSLEIEAIIALMKAEVKANPSSHAKLQPIADKLTKGLRLNKIGELFLI
jgi:hypothetical protein